MTFLVAFTVFHILVSLVEIAAGIAMVSSFIAGRPGQRSARVFFITAAITLVTGFLFPFHGVTPAIVIGLLNILILAATLIAKRKASVTKFWLGTYVIGVLALLYFNCLVLIVQSFQKIPGLHDLAPVGNEPAVLVSQTILLIVILAVGYLSFKGIRRLA